MDASVRLPRSLSLSRSWSMEPILTIDPEWKWSFRVFHLQGGGDVADLPVPDSEGEAAVKNFQDFLTNNNIR